MFVSSVQWQNCSAVESPVPAESCTGQDLADLGDRLRDWFQLLHGNAKQNKSGQPGTGTVSGGKTSLCTFWPHNNLFISAVYIRNTGQIIIVWLLLIVLERSLIASCKDSIGWMFSKLDTNSDLYLDQAELAAINLEKYEVCIRPFFHSCDSYKDGKVSTAEWCLCFWRESEWRDFHWKCSIYFELEVLMDEIKARLHQKELQRGMHWH